jgi:hypothetical protein
MHPLGVVTSGKLMIEPLGDVEIMSASAFVSQV